MTPFPMGRWRRGVALGLAAAPYLTPAKILNLLRCEAEKARRVARPRAFPYTAIIDVTNTCNLRCPYCPTGYPRDSGRTKSMIDLALVAKLIHEIGDYLVSAVLFNWGEPLLHPQIAAIVRMFQTKRIFTSISTNLNTRNNKVMEEVIEAGLDYLTVSFSGVTQEVYEQYHRRGRFDLLRENLIRITDYKRKHHLRKPILELKFLRFQYNRHEVEPARRLAAELGAEVFNNFPAGGAQEVIVGPDKDPQKFFPVFNYCHQLWHAVVLNADGGIAPCCYLFFKKDDLGDFARNSLREIRNNRTYVTARQLFDTGAVANLPKDLQHPCLKCHLVHEQQHLGNYLRSNPHAKQDHRTGGP